MDSLAGSTPFIFSSSHSPLAAARVFAGADTERDLFARAAARRHVASAVVPRAPSRVLRSHALVSARGRKRDGIAAAAMVGLVCGGVPRRMLFQRSPSLATLRRVRIEAREYRSAVFSAIVQLLSTGRAMHASKVPDFSN